MLQELLAQGISSIDLIDVYLRQIECHNKNGFKLNAIISTAPRRILEERAEMLDTERANGHIRGPLHGIPIVVKDNIMTDSSLGMDTTCGSYALVGAKAKNAPIISRLLAAGVIILAKANLSEWAGSKGYGIATGWSAIGGQTQTPYVLGGYVLGDKILGHSAPGGSSSGSAVAVAAGFAPLALGTESDGSITQPSGRSSLYGMKVTVGALSTQGTSPQSPLTDSLGGMAKTSQDLADLIGAMMETSYSAFLTGSWEGQKVAFVEPEAWELHPALREMKDVAKKIQAQQAAVTEGVVLLQADEISHNGKDALELVWNFDLAGGIDSFLGEYTESEVRTAEQLIQWNKEHMDLELPPEFPAQQQLENTVKCKLTQEERDAIAEFIRHKARNAFDRILGEGKATVLMGPLDGRIVTIAAAAGYPAGVVPLGYADNFNGRAYGMVIVAKAGGEGDILRAMSAWESNAIGKRVAPPLLANKAEL
ncbi:amidase family protein [Grosmannia clavigera kw1407]|uniref:Amidase family protein n=1 Tax=Grosmannia clavigera (strain kw1407 / UAMH 11150) TaxID=655863 RepID=F0X7J9_GROCL|nr:amidase family protein [Grosmannia clavigera kw1407]EFX06390.1 amidase family protein [Grosmannia clavigera kw1407]